MALCRELGVGIYIYNIYIHRLPRSDQCPLVLRCTRTVLEAWGCKANTLVSMRLCMRMLFKSMSITEVHPHENLLEGLTHRCAGHHGLRGPLRCSPHSHGCTYFMPIVRDLYSRRFRGAVLHCASLSCRHRCPRHTQCSSQTGFCTDSGGGGLKHLNVPKSCSGFRAAQRQHHVFAAGMWVKEQSSLMIAFQGAYEAHSLRMLMRRIF